MSYLSIISHIKFKHFTILNQISGYDPDNLRLEQTVTAAVFILLRYKALWSERAQSRPIDYSWVESAESAVRTAAEGVDSWSEY